MSPLPAFLANKGLSKIPFLTKIVDHFYKKDSVKTIYGHQMLLDSQDSMNLSRWGFYEREETERIQKTVQMDDYVVDIGANIGYFTCILAELVGPRGRVFAFEPCPRNYRLLCQNIYQNGFEDRVTVENCAVSYIDGWMTMFLSPISSGMHTLEASMLKRPTYQTQSTLSVKAVRLDSYFQDRIGLIDFTKIDVEGHEMNVLKGAKHFLEWNCHQVLMVEYAASPEVIPYLEERHFRIEKVNEKNLFAYPRR